MNTAKKTLILYILDFPSVLTKLQKVSQSSFKKTKIIIISQSPFYFDKFNKRDIVLKQVNLSKTLNYLYLINFFNLINS